MRLREWIWAPVLIFAGIVGPGLASARADVTADDVAATRLAICQALDEYPSVAGVAAVGEALMSGGLTGSQAAWLVGTAVQDDCPQYFRLLREFVTVYGHGGKIT